ncbi:hypothetical protein F503_04902 [Ophiostoma piceae UAMH 11346]|uniref:Uncharacterized protein n=1 Tax=Ophiostoma piceae (strain UAMH 11346) TaxID=1262450 RepID=S3BRY1_OPHP1|nr:hypothetical protein F503_04902 [Ophiostoma piceae UAMH 11346]
MPESPEKTHCLGLIDQRIRELDTPTTANDLQVDEDASISMKPAASIGVAYILGAILLLCFSLALGYRSLQSGNVTEIGSAA